MVYEKEFRTKTDKECSAGRGAGAGCILRSLSDYATAHPHAGPAELDSQRSGARAADRKRAA
jgi:hypothetical protein